MTGPVVILDNVDKIFAEGASNQVHALKEINLQIEENEFISLIGPSGCGKSTLLRAVGDLIEPSTGEVTVNGKSARQARLDQDYGIVFQAATLYDWRTVAKNVQLPLELMQFSRSEKESRTQAMLELVELTDFAAHYPWQLSGGMQQRVAIARALSFEPSILLMDEPFGALDEMTRERLNLELLNIWRKTETTVLFVTHSITEAVFLSTRVIVMSARPGRLTADIAIDLPQPRNTETRSSVRFFELETTVRKALRISESAAGETADNADGQEAAEVVA
jgi:NitT/TauT family transport system ATP-binding protein